MKKGILVTAIVIFVFIGFTVPVKKRFGHINDVTGSRKGWTIWFGNIKTSEWYIKTDLEDYAVTIDYPFDDYWISYQGTEMTLFNKRVSWGHGRPALKQSPEEINHLVSKLNDEEKLELLNLYKSQDTERIKETISSTDKGIF